MFVNARLKEIFAFSAIVLSGFVVIALLPVSWKMVRNPVFIAFALLCGVLLLFRPWRRDGR